MSAPQFPFLRMETTLSVLYYILWKKTFSSMFSKPKFKRNMDEHRALDGDPMSLLPHLFMDKETQIQRG